MVEIKKRNLSRVLSKRKERNIEGRSPQIVRSGRRSEAKRKGATLTLIRKGS